MDQVSAGLPFHLLANLFPLIEGEDFGELVADIRANGIREEIVLLGEKILDGRNRYRAGIAAGLIAPGVFRDGHGALLPQFRPFLPEFDGEPLAFVISRNLHRRHLSESQRALLASKLETYSHGGMRRAEPEPTAGEQDANWHVEAPAVTREQAAGIAKVSPRSVARARRVLDQGAPELVGKVERGEVSVSAAADLARLPLEQQQELIRSVDPLALYNAVRERREVASRVVKELRAEKQAAKKDRRAEREVALADRIEAGNAALVAAGAAGKRHGVILADPEWPFEVWSPETGMDRSAENHYPTSPIEDIAARPVQEIAADDCVLLLWVTNPHLESGLAVMKRWGFSYRTNFAGVKDRIGTGYWNRNKHELLLLGVRGNVPAPAMGTQFESVQPFPVKRHSQKPDFAHLIAEHYWPNVPKIELNARQARDGWDVWGAEAPVEIPRGEPREDKPETTGECPVAPPADGPPDVAGAGAAGPQETAASISEIPAFLRRTKPAETSA